MPASTTPIYPKRPSFGFATITAANTSSSGTGTIGTDIFLLETAGPDGTAIRKVRFIPSATTPTTTTATVGRVFLSTVSSGATTAANTVLVAEVALSSQSADNSATAVVYADVPIDFTVPAGWSILVTNHSAPAANSSWKAISIAGDY